MKINFIKDFFSLDGEVKKFVTIMKLSGLLLIMSLNIMATGYSQTTSLNLNVNNASIRNVFKEIESQSEFSFFFSDDMSELNETVSVNSKNEKINRVLDDIFEGTTLGYRILNDKLIVIAPKSVIDDRILTGKIVDKDGIPLAGASVSIKNTSTGVTTDGGGNFSIKVSDSNSIIVVAYLGYFPQEFKLEDRKTLDVTLLEDVQMMDEVVVVGYGVQKKVNLIGSVSTISAKDIENVPTSNITNTLSGRLTGVFGLQKSGAPGSGSNVMIRGKSTWNSTNPIYVIDGVVREAVDFESLSAHEIDNISVLKDATAAAVYGARSANGVILVTTKRGSNKKPTFTYNGNVGVEEPTKVPERMNAYEHGTYRNRVADFQLKPITDPMRYTPDELDYFKENKTNYDWFKGAWHNPISTQHDINVSGGSEKIRYFAGIGYYQQDGGFNNLNYNRYNLRSNVDADLAEGLVLGVHIDANMQKRERPYWPYDGGDDDRMYDLYRGLLNKPSMMPWKIGNDYVRAYQQWNPIALIDQAGNRTWNKNTFNGTLKLDYDLPFLKGLKAGGVFNYRKYYIYDKTSRKKYDVAEYKMSGGHNHIITDEVINRLQLGDWTNDNYASFDESNAYTLNLSLNYSQIFAEKHDVSAMILYEQFEGTGNYLYGYRGNALTSTIDQLFIGENNAQYKDATGSASEVGRLGYVGRVNYVYDSKYLFEFNFRYDASLKFPPNSRWGFFPSASLGWRLSEEGFIKNNFSDINNLKLRGSFGLLGNDGGDNVVNYGYLYKYNTSAGAVFGGGTSGITPGALPITNITWEKTAITNIGLDFQLWKGLLSMEIDYFYKHTYDILGSRIASVPNTFGATLPQENYGIVDNQGIEMLARHDNTIGKDFRYFLSGNFSFARNTVKKMDVAAGSFDYQQRVGRPIDFITGYWANGIARKDADLAGLPTYNGNAYSLGDIILRDMTINNSGDKNITSADMDVLSLQSQNPEIIYGFNLGGQWKGFDLDIFFQGVARRKILFPNRGDLWDEQAVLKIFTDTWGPDNVDSKYPRVGGIGASSLGASRAASSFWLMNGNYLRLKNVELGYTIPEVWIKKMGLQNVRLYISGANLLTFSPYDISDPETISGTYGVYQYPQMKSFNGGITVKF